MAKTFQGVDREFAVATGSNVNSGSGTSTFDYPPTSTFNLTVTSNPDDNEPNLFEIGETYDVSWSGSGGDSFLEDATVVRSDAAPDQGGVVVFEGLDEDGNLTQVVWSPDFDLENWYFNNFNQGASPGFYTSDQNPYYTHGYVCFAAETKINTPNGPYVVEGLRPRISVTTLDHGVQKVLWVGRRTVNGTGRNSPVLFEAGAIGNTEPLRLSQQHRVMVRSPLAELFFGHHEVLVPAKALINGRDIRLLPCASVTYVHILLKQHEILQAAGAAPCESLLPGDMTDTLLKEDAPQVRSLIKNKGTFHAARPVLTYREARCVVGARLPIRPAPAL